MEGFPAIVRAAAAGLTPEEARFSLSPADWSILHVVCHLADEEAEDFRARLTLFLSDPAAEWPPINPQAWPAERGYEHRDLAAELARFERERAASIAWLRGLRDPNWNAAKHHPKVGTFHAGDILGSWCAHDELHLRQIAKRRYQLAARDAAPYPVKYAGDW